AQRDWLKKHLATTSDKPCVLFVHHTLGDGDGDLLDAERLFQLIKPFPHVKAIFYGHSHQYSFDRRDAVHLINLPAVGYNFNDNQPVGWVDAKFGQSGVSLTLHAIGGNTANAGKTIEKSWI
ncbi:metallophosphoesterase, partial [Vicingaceae bacterium]|nr:metallophosphoesterase [Vicingaceae bacterium]